MRTAEPISLRRGRSAQKKSDIPRRVLRQGSQCSECMGNQRQVRSEVVTVRLRQHNVNAATKKLKRITGQQPRRQQSTMKTREGARDKATQFPVETVQFQAVSPSASRAQPKREARLAGNYSECRCVMFSLLAIDVCKPRPTRRPPVTRLVRQRRSHRIR